MKVLLLSFAVVLYSQVPVAPNEGPIAGVSGIRLRVSDPGKAGGFYTGVMGFAETAPGVFRVNGDQSIAFTQKDPAGPGDPVANIAFIANGPRASITDPDGHKIEFVTALKASGKASGADAKQISGHILHVGIQITDPSVAAEFYRRRFGFSDNWHGPTPTEFRLMIMRAPGTRDDYIELVQPPAAIPPGATMTHICFDVPDIHEAVKAFQAKGVQVRGEPRVASNGHFVFNMSDPNGVRLEFMEPQPAKTP